MAQRSIPGNQELAKRIRLRRNELNLTIEEAAARAGVGTKTWCRYESGEAIRQDKCKGICKALNWRSFPDEKNDNEAKSLVEEFREHEAWSQFLADRFGPIAAAAFAAGSDILLDHIQQDLADLATMPAGSHIGQLGTSFICDELPPQFLMQYGYDFLYHMKCALILLRQQAQHGMPIIAHSVLEELIIYLCNEEAQTFLAIGTGADDRINQECLANVEDWIFDLFEDMDIITFLYSNDYLTENHPYHFIHWNDRRFFLE